MSEDTKGVDAVSVVEGSLDFVLDSGLRKSLESDAKELDACFRAGAWKATMVLGGSIVEALLLDLLLAEEVVEDDGEPFEDKMQRLVAQLAEQQAEATKLDAKITANLKELGW